MAAIGPNLIIGRIPEGTFRNATNLRWNGENLSFGGRTNDSADLPTVREQILGLNNTVDSPVVPLTCDADTSLDGYYRVGRATVDFDPGSNALGHFTYDVELTRVPGRDAPRMELLTLGGLRSNSHSIAAGGVEPWCAIPAAAVDAWDGEATAPPHEFDVTRECVDLDGTINASGVGVYIYGTTGQALRLARFSVPPSAWYDGAATLTLDGDVVQGRQLPDTDASANLWEVTNGIVKVSPGSTAGEITVSNLDVAGTPTWTDHDYSLIYYDSGTPLTIDAWTTTTVIRNTPELVIVRIGARSGTRREIVVLDITMRRGARMAEFTLRTENSTAKKVVKATTSAGSLGTGFVRRSAGDPRWIIAAPLTFTDDLVNGGLTGTTSRLDFGIGLYETGSSGAEDLASIVDQYYAPCEPWQFTVGR